MVADRSSRVASYKSELLGNNTGSEDSLWFNQIRSVTIVGKAELDELLNLPNDLV